MAKPRPVSRGAEIEVGGRVLRVLRLHEGPAANQVWTYRVALLLITCAVWESLHRFGIVSDFWISSPSLVLIAFYKSLAAGKLIINVVSSLYEALIAFVLASGLGIVCGLLLARSPLWDEVLWPFVTAINTIPRVALAPLIIVWFGIGITAKVVTAMTLVFFILLVNTASGAKNVDPDLIIITRLMGAGNRELLRKVILPSALPWIFAALNLGLTYSLLGVVVAEILSSNRGIGFMIANSAGNFDTTGVFVGLLALAVVTWALSSLMRLVEARLLKWKPAGPAGG